MIVFLLGALDQTVVSTAMPRIIAQLNGLALYPWVTTAYLLSSTVVVPIWGKLSDLYGRKAVLLWGVSLFILGSWLAGLSGEFGDLPILGGGMVQLIVFRAIQGLGGGALFFTAFAIIADMFSPRERAKFGGLFGSMFALASVVGPVIGGFFTDHGTMRLFGHVVEGWRWVFYVNLPLSLISLFMIIVKMPPLTNRRSGSVDYIGAGLLIVAFIPLLLAMSFGGQDYAWGSPMILGLLAASVAGIAAFLWIETKVLDPIVPLGLFANRTFSTANASAFIMSMAFMGVVTYLPLYMQVGQGVPATRSGITLLALMLGLIASSTLNGLLVSRTGRYKPFMLAGGVVLLGGIASLCFIDAQTSTLSLMWRLLIVGIGLGPLQSLYGLAVQNAVPQHQMGVAISSSQFFRQIGSTMGVALAGALLTHNLAVELERRVPREPGAIERKIDIGALQKMAMRSSIGSSAPVAPLDPKAAAVEQATKDGFAAAIVRLFLASIAVIALGIGLTLLIPALPMRGRHAAESPGH